MNINPNIKASELIATTITGVRPFAYEIAEVNGTTVTLAKTNDPFKSDISFVYRTENCVGASLTKRAMELMGQGDIKPRAKILIREKPFSRNGELELLFGKKLSAANSNIPIISFDPDHA